MKRGYAAWALPVFAGWIGGAVLLSGLGLSLGSPGSRWESVRAQIRMDFPEVRQIGTADLAKWLGAKDREKPFLLDVRTEREFAVSHLRGARRLAPEARGAVLDLHVRKDAPVVVYCSVGYRSSAMAARLGAAGYENVANLDGSIFQWANEDRPLWRGETPMAVVHPYNRWWGSLLKKSRRAAETR